MSVELEADTYPEGYSETAVFPLKNMLVVLVEVEGVVSASNRVLQLKTMEPWLLHIF